jgi:hypothetical protein
MSDSPTPPNADDPPRQGWLDSHGWLFDEWILVLQNSVAMRDGMRHWTNGASAIVFDCALFAAR